MILLGKYENVVGSVDDCVVGFKKKFYVWVHPLIMEEEMGTSDKQTCVASMWTVYITTGGYRRYEHAEHEVDEQYIFSLFFFFSG